jgi:hypothetical protein
MFLRENFNSHLEISHWDVTIFNVLNKFIADWLGRTEESVLVVSRLG